jgi:hypothetical protein
MLQRSQTLYLLGILVLSILMFTGPMARYVVEGGELALKHSGVYGPEGEKMDLATWPMTLLFVAVSVLSLFSILSYRNRIRQMRLCIFLILLCVGMSGIMFYYTWIVGSKFESTQTLYLWRFILPPICIIMFYLAFRRIRRDELLVKAFDRIR